MSLIAENTVAHTVTNSSDQSAEIRGQFCEYRGDRFYKIEHFDAMPTFFMSVVSAYDHWLFIASNGGLTAGRQNSEKSLFPYYTEDKLTDMAHCTGSVTLIRENGVLWQPLNPVQLQSDNCQRTIYKSVLGDRLFFSEEKNGLQFEYGWSFSDRFGLVKTTRLTNLRNEAVNLKVLDGLQNLLPANVGSSIQNQQSVLLDAYKSTDLVDDTLGVYYLSSQLTDVAEPAESLVANTVWYTSSDERFSPTVSISTDALHCFANGKPVAFSERVRGKRGVYFMQADLSLSAGDAIEWHTVCEISLDRVEIEKLLGIVASRSITELLESDIHQGSTALKSHLSKADGLQTGGDEETTVHHAANTLFNIMRGGLFEDGYTLTKADLKKFVVTRHRDLAEHSIWSSLPESFDIAVLADYIPTVVSHDLRRLLREYLPISFSRRHGDPSRPWNRFSINLKDEQGQAIKDYQGNWRDIFQNWEPLAYSYPSFLPAMISAFLNATTADGYNPYRVTRDGIEWEEPEPDNPWANIGYWSDHQIIYLSKLLELQVDIDPTIFSQWLREPTFSYANVPYRIKPFNQLVQDPYSSITFDAESNHRIEQRVGELGTDGKLLMNAQGQVAHGSLMEKLLTLWLAKLSNFVPGGGIWMNTQRPEWNDANNALVGWGLSMVTLAYLHRHLAFMQTVLRQQKGEFPVAVEVQQWFSAVANVLHQTIDCRDDSQRYQVLSSLATAADAYRAGVYEHGLSGTTGSLTFAQLTEFVDQVVALLRDTLLANEREDGLFHSYNLLHLDGERVDIEYLPVMLEGQVAVLSSQLLSPEQSLNVLNALRKSDLYRSDQHTYLLYPNKQLPAFLAKNSVDVSSLEHNKHTKALLAEPTVFKRGSHGQYHFNAKFRNAKELLKALSALNCDDAVQAKVLTVYEQTFNHKSFTGRSGSFFAYEGLGSTYWHMVSKLLLAAQENWQSAVLSGAPSAVVKGLYDRYYDVRAGIGFNKDAKTYGAFPTDPYSHTPETGIARQPGMTGQVKEELLTRLGELGLHWHNESIVVVPGLLKANEFLTRPARFSYLALDGQWKWLDLPSDTLAFSLAQVPFVYNKVTAKELKLIVHYHSGEVLEIHDQRFPKEVARDIKQRNDQIRLIEVDYPIDFL